MSGGEDVCRETALDISSWVDVGSEGELPGHTIIGQTFSGVEDVGEKSLSSTQISQSPSLDEFYATAFVRSLPLLYGGVGETLSSKELLGVGGMGQVELAVQASLQRDVAVKRLKSDRDTEMAARHLLHESMISGLLSHPNIIPVHLLGRDEDDRPCLVMRRVEGVSWETLLDEPEHPLWHRRKTRSTQPLTRHIEILMDICDAVDYAHSKGIVHRDIKPDNVMVGEFGEVYLLDWGLGVELEQADDVGFPRLSFPSPVGGTPSYMAPEMVRGKIDLIDERTDIFLLGATLHRILTGQARNAGRSVREAMFSSAMIGPFQYGDEVPKELATIANRATAREPEKRFASVRALREALVDYLRHTHSHDLHKGAEVRLQQLEALMNQGSGLVAPQLAQLTRRLFNECRFGFLQAIDAWDGNAPARVGLQRSLVLIAQFEVNQKNLDNAVAWFNEIEHPPATLAAGVQALHEEQLKEERERDRLEHRAHEFDFDVGIGHRTALLLALGLGVGLMATLIAIGRRMGWFSITYTMLQMTIVICLVVLSIICWHWRKALMSNRIGRRFMYLFASCMATMALMRLGGSVGGVSIVYVLQFEMLLFCVTFAAGAQLFSMTLLWSSLICVLCFGLALVWPGITYELYVFLCFFLFLCPAYLLRHIEQREAQVGERV